MKDLAIRFRAWRAFLLKDAVLFLFALPAACGPTLPEGEFTVTVNPGSGPPEPQDISAKDQSSVFGNLRVSKVLLSGESWLCWKARVPTQPEGGEAVPAWTLSLTLEGSVASAQDDIQEVDGYLVIKDVRINPPAQVGVDWDMKDVRLSFVLDHDLGSGFNFSFGAGYGHASVGLQYGLSDGSSIYEHQSLDGLDAQVGVTLHMTTWLELGIRGDFLVESKPVKTFDAAFVIRPWGPVGIIAGWRISRFIDDQRSGSPLQLDASGPLIGLDLRF